MWLTCVSRYSQGYRWFGFVGGSHRCRGEQFAYVQIKTIWAYLLRNYDMKLACKLPEPDYTAMVVGPLKPYVTRAYSNVFYLKMVCGIVVHGHECSDSFPDARCSTSVAPCPVTAKRCELQCKPA